jgi:hypothetical protein
MEWDPAIPTGFLRDQSGHLRNEPLGVGSGLWIARRPELWQAADYYSPRV